VKEQRKCEIGEQKISTTASIQENKINIPITFTSSVSRAAMIFFVQVSTTDVSGGVDDMKRVVKEGAAAAVTYLEPIAATAPLVLLCAVNERAMVFIWARVARRRRDFIMEDGNSGGRRREEEFVRCVSISRA
jgi:hypothetical protein